jgi:GcrA cell cycle regulator
MSPEAQARADRWTPELVEQLRSLYVDGKSASETATILGNGFTRNSIIGKWHRLHLPPRSPIARHQRIARVEREKMARPKRVRTKRAAPLKKSQFAPFGAPVNVAPMPGNMRALRGAAWEALPGTNPVALVDLAKGQCKWPIGDRPMLFCAAPAGDHRYCEVHEALSTRKVPAEIEPLSTLSRDAHRRTDSRSKEGCATRPNAAMVDA